MTGKKIAIAGLGVTGRAVAHALLGLIGQPGSPLSPVELWGVDAGAKPDSDQLAPLAARGLKILAEHQSLDDARDFLDLHKIDLLVASPGWPPSAPLLTAARYANIRIWSEAELAWRLRGPNDPQWLVVTGTNGKTTTVRMLAEILTAAGRKTLAVGNIGTPLIAAALDPNLDVLAVELSSFQLHHTYTMAPLASALLNIAPDHLDWHGGFDAYVGAKGRVFTNTTRACLYNLADPRTEELLREADVANGARAIGVSLGVPSLGSLGVVEGHFYDRGFYADRRASALEIASIADLQEGDPDGDDDKGATLPAHIALDALFAAGLALAAGVDAGAISAGLRAFSHSANATEHRGEIVGVLNGVTYVNNSKATNTHAARAAFSGRDPQSVVWILGGQTKGADMGGLIESVVPYLRGAVLIGVERREIAQLFARHAPDLPVIEIDEAQTGTVASSTKRGDAIMNRAVWTATKLAKPGDTVLLAPACASQDQFASYEARGAAFSDAVSEVAK